MAFFIGESLRETPRGLDQKMRKPVPPRGRTGLPVGGESFLQLAFEIFAGAELHAFGSFDLDAFAGLGIHAHAGFAVDDFERAEADQLHDFAFFEVRFDALDDGVDGAFGIGLGAVEFLLDGFNEFDFVHGLGVRDFDRRRWTTLGFFPMSRGDVNRYPGDPRKKVGRGKGLTEEAAGGPWEA